MKFVPMSNASLRQKNVCVAVFHFENGMPLSLHSTPSTNRMPGIGSRSAIVVCSLSRFAKASVSALLCFVSDAADCRATSTALRVLAWDAERRSRSRATES